MKTQGTQAPVLERVFSRSIAARLLVSMPSVPVGSANYPIMTAGTDAGMKNPGVAQDAAAATFEGFTLDPKRLTARYLFRIEDQYKLRGYEAVLRRDLSAVMSDAMDNQIVNGDGTSPDVSGFLKELTAPGADNAVTSWGGYFGKFSSLVDGLERLWAFRCSSDRGQGHFRLCRNPFPNRGERQRTPRFGPRVCRRSRIGGMSVSSRIPATATSGTLNKHQSEYRRADKSYPGRNAVAPDMASIQRHSGRLHGRGFGRSRHYRHCLVEFQNPAGNRLFALRGAERGIAGGLPCFTEWKGGRASFRASDDGGAVEGIVIPYGQAAKIARLHRTVCTRKLYHVLAT